MFSSNPAWMHLSLGHVCLSCLLMVLSLDPVGPTTCMHAPDSRAGMLFLIVLSLDHHWVIFSVIAPDSRASMLFLTVLSFDHYWVISQFGCT